MTDLRALFAGLPLPPEAPADAPILAAVPVLDKPCFRVACDRSRRPILLLESPRHGAGLPPLALEHIRIEHARQCRVQASDGGLSRGVFTIFACTSADTVLQDHFLLVAGALVAATPPHPEPGAVAMAVETMAELFRALQAPARASVQGLWGEVFLMAESRRPVVLARAWRVAFDDRFDFSMAAMRVEVKSTRGATRVHHFSLEQLRPPPGVRVLVASLRVDHAGGGASLEDLLAELRAALAGAPDVLLHVESVIATTLGTTYQAAIAERFDRAAARASLAYFRAEDVPSLREALPPAVTDVHFRADLAGVLPVLPRAVALDGGDALIESLPRAAMPTGP